jgi:nitroreductase/NAD-dependent dihydropyrimidine dehydrogenase PreA subunit
MPEMDFKVDGSLCVSCGACVKDCPASVLELSPGAAPSVCAGSEGDCIACQHCLAVCPVGAISIFGVKPADLPPLKDSSLPSLKQLSALLRGRRSVRQYRKENVKPELIDELLACAANAPTGCNHMALTFTVVDDKDLMESLLERTVEALLKASSEGRVSDSLGFLSAGAKAYAERGEDVIFRGAPHLLIVSAEPDALCAGEDVAIALSYFELLAQRAGLGAVWCGYLKYILDSLPELRELYGVPQGVALYAMLFGYPASTLRYARGVKREAFSKVKRLRA